MIKEKPKTIVVYLPQFHETYDNNMWWGKGFTDWKTVKEAEKYFDSHNAPWKPLNDNYYNLDNYDVMKWQANLAKEYCIDGFCFYHYYFANGNKELEKPAENLLNWKDLDMPFCFNWANESWIRSWSKVNGNVWSEKYEKSETNLNKGILIEQDYGNKVEWKKHFEYLLPFFMDSRYITIQNKPLFIFYKPNDIQKLDEMVRYWRDLATEAGLAGLYLVGANSSVADSELDASLVYEPRTSINSLNKSNKVVIKNGVRCYEYNELWNSILEDREYIGCKTYFSGVIGYDDTPRRGSSGECVIGRTPKLYEKGLKKLIEKSWKIGNEILILNAWNEWGEGMYLEPDEKEKYMYLEATKNAINCAKIEKTYLPEEKNNQGIEEIIEYKKDLKKYKAFISIFDHWLEVERLNKFNFKTFFKKNGVATIAVYGMSMMGKQLIQQLLEEEISPLYGIDRYIGQLGENLEIFRPEDELPDVDAIIVTTYDNDGIIRMLKNKTNSKIFKLEDLIEYFWRLE